MSTGPNTALLEALRHFNEDAALADLNEEQTDHVLAELEALRDRLGPKRGSLRRRAFDTPSQFRAEGNLFHAGEFNPVVPQLDLQFEENAVRCEWMAGPLDEGPPGFLHGGLSAYILDVLSGVLVQSLGVRAVTGTLDLRYHRAVPLHEPLVMNARVEQVDGRKIFVNGQIAFQGLKAVESNGLFIELMADSHLTASALKRTE